LKKISICIPTYNRWDYLKRCLYSLLSNPSENLEILVSDNNSPYDIDEILMELDDPRVISFKNENNIGPRLNFNKLLNLATGDFLLFITDDDFMLPNSIHKIFEFIENYDVDCFRIGIVNHLVTQNKFTSNNVFNQNVIFSISDLDKSVKLIQQSNILTGTCIKKSTIDIDFLNKNAHFWYPSIGLMLFGKKFGYLNDILFVHTWENEVDWGIDTMDRELAMNKLEMIQSIVSYKGIPSEFAESLMIKIVQIELHHKRIINFDEVEHLFNNFNTNKQFKIDRKTLYQRILELYNKLMKGF